MKLCIECKWFGGVKASNGSYVCREPRNEIVHPVDGLPTRLDASWLRMAPEFQHLCGMGANWWQRKE